LLAILDQQAVGVADREADLLRAAGQVLHIEGQHGAVADREEAWRRQFDDQRRGDGDLGFLPAEALAAGGDGHQPQAAVEIGDRQRNLRLAVFVEHAPGR
jgi:hypothetical protein